MGNPSFTVDQRVSIKEQGEEHSAALPPSNEIRGKQGTVVEYIGYHSRANQSFYQHDYRVEIDGECHEIGEQWLEAVE